VAVTFLPTSGDTRRLMIMRFIILNLRFIAASIKTWEVPAEGEK